MVQVYQIFARIVDNLDRVDVGGMTEYPSFYYCIAVYIALIVILSAFIIVHIRNSSLEKEVF